MSAVGDDVIAHLSVRENSALSGGTGSRDSSRDSIQRGCSPAASSDNGRLQLKITDTAAAGSDVISLDPPPRPLPEVVAARGDVAARQPEVELLGWRGVQQRGRELNVEDRLTQTRRAVTSLTLSSVVIFIYILLTSLTQSLASQRAGILVLVVWVTFSKHQSGSVHRSVGGSLKSG